MITNFKIFESIIPATLIELLCVYSDHDNFTVGNLYKVVRKPEVDIIGSNTAFYITLESNNMLTAIELYTSSKLHFKDELTNMFETLIFTQDKSLEEYKIRKNTRKYNI